MRRPPVVTALAVAGLSVAASAGCGSQEIQVAKSDPPQVKQGAVLFSERCSGCHTLRAAGAQGSKPERGPTVRPERTDGPNFNYRVETPQTVLYAVRNGGFSGAIMPANIVVGQDAQAVAAFVSKYAGRQRKR